MFDLDTSYTWLREVDEDTCKTLCLEEEQCVAVEYSRACTYQEYYCNDNRWVCKLVKTGTTRAVLQNYNSKIIVFLSKIQNSKGSLILQNSKVKAEEGFYQELTFVDTPDVVQCMRNCSLTPYCDIVDVNHDYGVFGKCYQFAADQKLSVVFSEKPFPEIPPDQNAVHFVWKDPTTSV